jgi:hypothetical protein
VYGHRHFRILGGYLACAATVFGGRPRGLPVGWDLRVGATTRPAITPMGRCQGSKLATHCLHAPNAGQCAHSRNAISRLASRRESLAGRQSNSSGRLLHAGLGRWGAPAAARLRVCQLGTPTIVRGAGRFVGHAASR